MQKWENVEIVSERIEKQEGFLDMKIKVGDEKEQIYSYPRGDEELEKVINELLSKDWELIKTSEKGYVTTYYFRRPLDN